MGWCRSSANDGSPVEQAEDRQSELSADALEKRTPDGRGIDFGGILDRYSANARSASKR
jgi:hypothetical protein